MSPGQESRRFRNRSIFSVILSDDITRSPNLGRPTRTTGAIHLVLAAAQLLISAVLSSTDLSASEPIFHSRSYNAFTQVFGLPEFFAGRLLPEGDTEARAVFNLVSFDKRESNRTESLEMDGETYQLALNIDHSLTPRWEVGARVPFLYHSGGFMDGFVDAWHDFFNIGVGSRNRQGQNELEFSYLVEGEPGFELTKSNGGIGDVQLRTRLLITEPSRTERQLALHAGIKLPTGNDKYLFGSGATDYSVGIGYSDPLSLAKLSMTLSANAGVLFLGDGNVLGDIQKDRVPYGGLQLTFDISERFALLGQIQGAGPYYDSSLDALGGTTIQLAFGANVHFPRGRWDLRFGIIEDGLSEVTPDFTLHLEIVKVFGYGGGD
jgi:hypothetical protein